MQPSQELHSFRLIAGLLLIAPKKAKGEVEGRSEKVREEREAGPARLASNLYFSPFYVGFFPQVNHN